MRLRFARQTDVLGRHTRALPPLAPGATVLIQNQTGQHPKRWDRTGRVVDVKANDQYAVKVHGSGRVTLRNRRYLRPITSLVPFEGPLEPCPPPPIPSNAGDAPPYPTSVAPTHRAPSSPPCHYQRDEVDEDIPSRPASVVSEPDATPRGATASDTLPIPSPPQALTSPRHPVFECLPSPSPGEKQALPTVRRSQRARRPPAYLADYQWHR